MRSVRVKPFWGFSIAVSIGLSAMPVFAGQPLARDGLSQQALYNQSAVELERELAAGRVSSEQLVRAYLARIKRMDRRGPSLHAVISVNRDAIRQARELDRERRTGHVRGPLHGLPILVKDNIETHDAMPTTAGSLALARNYAINDAAVIARLRAAGMIVIAKANMSEWANFRSPNGLSGWSAMGGLVRNPRALDRTACGSSSGTAAGMAAGYAAIGIGTETDGSITCPAAMTGVVGFKPTLGLVSRTGIVPISDAQDTAGPIGHSVSDIALLLSVMAGSDPRDRATIEADTHRRDYVAALSDVSLKGIRLAVIRPRMSAAIAARFDAALEVFRKAGAVLVEVPAPDASGLQELEFSTLASEFHSGLDSYLAKTPETVRIRSLSALISFNLKERRREMPLFGQELLEAAQRAPAANDPQVIADRQRARVLAGREGLDRMLQASGAAALLRPTEDLPWPASSSGPTADSLESAATLPAIAGNPHLTVPMGQVQGLPVGLSIIGRQFDDASVLRIGNAFEHAAETVGGFQI